MISVVDKFCSSSSDNEITLAICFTYFTGENCLGKVAHLVWNFPRYRNTMANYLAILSRDLYFLKFQLLLSSPLCYLLSIWKKAFFVYKLPPNSNTCLSILGSIFFFMVQLTIFPWIVFTVCFLSNTKDVGKTKHHIISDEEKVDSLVTSSVLPPFSSCNRRTSVPSLQSKGFLHWGKSSIAQRNLQKERFAQDTPSPLLP